MKREETSSSLKLNARSFFQTRKIIKNIELDKIMIRGAKQHNLKDINVSIPRNKFIVITGVSGSGKSSLAFDTIYAESQRRFMESLSPFIRHRMEKFEKPKVDYIDGLSPAVAIEQKKISNNPRSTVGTITEIISYLRLLYSRAGTRHCIKCREEIRPMGAINITSEILGSISPGSKIVLLAPLSYGGEIVLIDKIEQARQLGVEVIRIDGAVFSLGKSINFAKTNRRSLEFVVDEFRVPDGQPIADEEVIFGRVLTAVSKCLELGQGKVAVLFNNNDILKYTSNFICPNCGEPFPELTSQHLSYNSPLGMCIDCQGLGVRLEVDPELLIDDPKKSILDGALSWFGNLRQNKRSTWPIGPLEPIATYYDADLNRPWQELPEKFRNVIIYGSGDEKIRFPARTGQLKENYRAVKGLVPEIARLFRETIAENMQKKYSAYMRQLPCSSCGGSRLNFIARSVKLNGMTIADINNTSIHKVLIWVEELYENLDDEQHEIADEILLEVHNRLSFMVDIGLHYLTLDRTAPSLAGGEGQRVRLASQLGSGLVGVLYILDEPTIGLHMRDHHALLNTLFRLRDFGNTVLVVEHDSETMKASDWIIDLGPGPGVLGGYVVAAGTLDDIKSNPESLTGRYLKGELTIVAPNSQSRRKPGGGWLTLGGAKLHNLQNITVQFPLGLLTCVTGVSGSGKSSLIAQTLEPALARYLNHAHSLAGEYTFIKGIDNLDKVVSITQGAIGRTPRSNPATYTKVFNEIRDLFANTSGAKNLKLNSSHFSFNSKEGRCQVCRGYGQKKIEMHFLADVFVTCSECNGTRYSSEILKVYYRGMNIADVLNMDITEAFSFFIDHPKIVKILKTLCDVGLGYLQLGQSATTLSGGEAQRVKLSSELSRIATGRTIYILDEPTTGLHFNDIQYLLNVLHTLVDEGNTVIIIEHNLEVIRTADWIIDLGPGGGEAGGRVIAQGTPEEVAQVEDSQTGRYLRKNLEVIYR